MKLFTSVIVAILALFPSSVKAQQATLNSLDFTLDFPPSRPSNNGSCAPRPANSTSPITRTPFPLVFSAPVVVSLTNPRANLSIQYWPGENPSPVWNRTEAPGTNWNAPGRYCLTKNPGNGYNSDTGLTIAVGDVGTIAVFYTLNDTVNSRCADVEIVSNATFVTPESYNCSRQFTPTPSGARGLGTSFTISLGAVLMGAVALRVV